MMQDILEPYNEQPVTKSRFYMVIVILTVVYLCYFILDTFFDINNFQSKGFNSTWISLAFGVLIPAISLGFFIAKTKGGWFMLATYFSFIAILAIEGLGKTLLNEGIDYIFSIRSQHLFICVITINLSILLQLSSIKSRCRIDTTTWIVMLVMAAFFASCFIFLD